MLIMPKQETVETPTNDKVKFYINNSGLISTKDSTGLSREYRPSPLESEGMIYGVKWDSVNDVMTPGIVLNGTFIASDYSNYPIQEKIGRGILNKSTNTWTKLNKFNSSKLENGSPATLDGSVGHVMVQIPRHYQLVTKSGNFVYILCSEFPFTFNSTPAWIPPAFLNKPHFYVGAFQGVALTDSSTSKIGSVVLDTSSYSTQLYPNPYTNVSRANFRTRLPDGVGSGLHIQSYGMYEALYVLMLTEFKTWAIQEQLEGHTERTGAWDYAWTQPVGLTLGMGDFSGSIWNDSLNIYTGNSYRGIEHVFGNVWHVLDGINIDNTAGGNQRVWICYEPTHFADDTTTNYIDTGFAPGWGEQIAVYIKNIYAAGKHIPLYPTEFGGAANASTFITDAFWSSALGGGWRVLRVGGRANGSRRAGVGCRASADSSAYASSSVGVRLGGYI